MSTKKYNWLAFGIASVLISGCATGSHPRLNLGVADALRKTSCLFHKKGIAYEEHIVEVSPTEYPTYEEPVVTSDCGCNSSAHSEFFTPTEISTEPTAQQLTPEADDFDSISASSLPLEDLSDSQGLENPLPPAVEPPRDSTLPPAEVLNFDSNLEGGKLETLDSAASDQDDINQELDLSPEDNESSILETAAKGLSPQPPTSAGHSIVEHRSKMLTLVARPAQSHRVFDGAATMVASSPTQQVTHKRHYRHQNALRPRRSQPNNVVEHIAEVPSPVKFKPLPQIQRQSLNNPVQDSTGAPAFNQKSASTTVTNGSGKSSTEVMSTSEPTQLSVDSDDVSTSNKKSARLPILKAETTSSAPIGSLRNFTNVHSMDQDYYNPNKKAIKTIQATATENSTLTRVKVLRDDGDLPLVR